jgi:hypothetical protein
MYGPVAILGLYSVLLVGPSSVRYRRNLTRNLGLKQSNWLLWSLNRRKSGWPDPKNFASIFLRYFNE